MVTHPFFKKNNANYLNLPADLDNLHANLREKLFNGSDNIFSSANVGVVFPEMFV